MWKSGNLKINNKQIWVGFKCGFIYLGNTLFVLVLKYPESVFVETRTLPMDISDVLCKCHSVYRVFLSPEVSLTRCSFLVSYSSVEHT